jgi:hypothetical protein
MQNTIAQWSDLHSALKSFMTPYTAYPWRYAIVDYTAPKGIN